MKLHWNTFVMKQAGYCIVYLFIFSLSAPCCWTRLSTLLPVLLQATTSKKDYSKALFFPLDVIEVRPGLKYQIAMFPTFVITAFTLVSS